MTSSRSAHRRLAGGVDHHVEREAFDAGTHRAGDGGRAGERHARIVRESTGLRNAGDEFIEIERSNRDGDRSDAHRRAVGVTATAHLFGIPTGHERVDGPLGRWSQQIERSLRLHRLFPVDEGVGPTLNIDFTVTRDEFGRQQHGLFGVVGDSSGRHAFGDGVIGRRRFKIDQQGAEDTDDLVSRHHLRRHSERVTDGEAVEGAGGTIELGHGLHPLSL